MTLNEAIKHCEEVAKEQEELYGLCGLDSRQCDGTKDCKVLKNRENKGCIKCARDHRQLGEWLKELKRFREQKAYVMTADMKGE